jgi:predicted amidophosphoribosyltransferase
MIQKKLKISAERKKIVKLRKQFDARGEVKLSTTCFVVDDMLATHATTENV